MLRSLFLTLLLIGCQGAVSDAGGDEPIGPIDPRNPPPGFCEDAPPMLGHTPIRRLSRVEYLNTIDSLFGGMTLDLPEIPTDETFHGFENAADNLNPSPLLVERYETVASSAAEAVMADDAARSRVLSCSSWDTTEEQDSCANTFLDEFGQRAFRRPLTIDERNRYLDAIRTNTEMIDFEAGIELAISALLQAPQMTYRVELGDGAGNLEPFEVASRLSFLLWQGPPDDVLLAAATAGELATTEQLEAQATRMLEMPPARNAMVDFHRQWLDFDRVLSEPKAAADYPNWNPALQSAIREESERFIGSVMFDGPGTIDALFNDRTVWVNGPLADLYGLEATSEWTERTLPEGERSGILTRSAFLAGHARPGNGSPPLRGVFVMEQILCAPLPPPPDGIDTSVGTAEPGEGPFTNRQLFAQRTQEPACIACHLQIDGLGFGFENFDTTGAYRTTDNGLDVDASGELVNTDVDGRYDGAVEMSELLSQSQDVADCLTTQWVRYTVGREVAGEDTCLMETASEALSTHGGDVRQLLIAIASSPHFLRGGVQ